MTSQCTASKSGPGSIAGALYHAFDLGQFCEEISDYYFWAYSSYYVFRQTKTSSSPGGYITESEPLMSWLAGEVLEDFVNRITKDGYQYKFESASLKVEFWAPGKKDEGLTVRAHRVRGPAIGRRTPKKIRKRRLKLVDLWSERHVP